MTAAQLDRSNSLTDLAARIRTYHEATVAALRTSVIHAMAAGDLLIEAKTQLRHGHWLPWLAEHCAMSERTAQLYMKIAKNRLTIEKSAPAADLTLNEAAALCVLAGRLEKMMDFTKRAEACDPEELVSLAVAEGFEVIRDNNYNAFAGRSEAERRDWMLFGFFIGNGSESAFDHVEWLLQRPFQSVDEWLGAEGDDCRASWHMRSMPDKFKKNWAQFHADHAGKTLDEIMAEVDHIRARHMEAAP